MPSGSMWILTMGALFPLESCYAGQRADFLFEFGDASMGFRKLRCSGTSKCISTNNRPSSWSAEISWTASPRLAAITRIASNRCSPATARGSMCTITSAGIISATRCSTASEMACTCSKLAERGTLMVTSTKC